MKIDKVTLVKRIQLYRDGEQARTDKANAERQAKYDKDRAKYEQELLPHFLELYKVLANTVARSKMPELSDIPEYFRNHNWTWIFNGPSKPVPEQSGVEYYDTMLAFLEAVTDATVSEQGMTRAGFRDIGRFFAAPESAVGNRHAARTRV